MSIPVLDRTPSRGRADVVEAFRRVRSFTEALAEPLAAEDYVVQSMPDCSPTKWHLAHVSWFFETFVLGPQRANYRSLNPQYTFLFNSYYNAIGERHARAKRGLLSRPTVDETYAYRAYVDEHMLDLLELAEAESFDAIEPTIVLGLNHEQQHQELLVTDAKHMLAQNSLHPVYRARQPDRPSAPPALRWVSFAGGVVEVGHTGEGFAFDNEGPRHAQLIHPFELGSRPVTNAEYLAFMADAGYQRPELWLSAGWATVQESGWNAPLYWEPDADRWLVQTLAGLSEVVPAEPVCHISYFEADAYARWAGARLPTEFEWEVAAQSAPLEGNFIESGRLHPAPLVTADADSTLARMFGDVWEWTQSSYSPYRGYQPAEGAIGEYNGKFMCNQYVLRGGSCATPASHIRRTYRNFFPPDARWQFMGLRLARDI
jgi:ergothioneine biosynthesis protein EgtB